MKGPRQGIWRPNSSPRSHETWDDSFLPTACQLEEFVFPVNVTWPLISQGSLEALRKWEQWTDHMKWSCTPSCIPHPQPEFSLQLGMRYKRQRTGLNFGIPRLQSYDLNSQGLEFPVFENIRHEVGKPAVLT